jgi:UDP-galactopyranose mutase
MIQPQGRRLPDVICFSHLRWNFVFQRPQHLMTRCARECGRLYFFEEPIYEDGGVPRLEIRPSKGVQVVVPCLPSGLDEPAVVALQRELLDHLIARERIQAFIAWYYTPMALPFSQHLAAAAVVYDCMDELASFKNAPAVLKQREAALMSHADLVLTGGQSLYEAKRHQHDNIHPFPSSVDVAHFGQARQITEDPPDQDDIPHPRLGFFGVIDERMDIDLIDGVAQSHPDWHVVLLGPVLKIDPAQLPRRPNIHYLGPKPYDDLPEYIAGWDVALLPFARNEATRFISPTKTPEYMAAGLPVVSTSIRDVVRPYGQQGLVRIADDVPAFVAACEAALEEDASERVRQADAFLRQTSWDGTWLRIRRLVEQALQPKQARADVTAGNLAG